MGPVEHMIHYFHLEPHITKENMMTLVYGLYYLAISDIGTPSQSQR